jgi:hypothetical protein
LFKGRLWTFGQLQRSARRVKHSWSKLLHERRWPWVALVLIILFTTLVRSRLAGMPLERDEGEFAYAGQLLLEGIPPYQLAYSMKLPGVPCMYAASMALFGATPTGVHLGLLLVNAATIVLVFVLSRRFFDVRAGLIAATAYAVLSLGVSVFGLAAHATHFVVFFALAGMAVLLTSSGPLGWGRCFWGGLLLGLGFLMKQAGLAFVLMGGFHLCLGSEKIGSPRIRQVAQRLGFYLAGVSLPCIIGGWLLYRAGVFEKFWFWTVTYAREYATLIGLGHGLANFLVNFPNAVGPHWLLWLWALLGLWAVWRLEEWRAGRRAVLSFVFFSILSVCPGLFFRQHYFITLLPAVAVLAGGGFVGLSSLVRAGRVSSRTRQGLVVALIAALILPIWAQRSLFFQLSPVEVCARVYRLNPFVESAAIAEHLRTHSEPTDRIAILGSEPQIYFYAHRKSATGYIYTYSLVESHRLARQMQDEMIAEIEEAMPRYLLFVNIPFSWLVRPNADNRIFEWYPEYCTRHYTLAGFVDVPENGPAIYRWGEAAQGHAPESKRFILAYERRPTATTVE